MEVTLDLISDLNIINSLDWEGQPESLICLVAGNVSSDREVVYQTLRHLGQQYKHVFYVDGPNDHAWNMDDIAWSYIDLVDQVEEMDNVTFLHNQICMLGKLAIVPVNGWFSFDFNINFEKEQQFMWMKENGYRVQSIDDVDRIKSYGISDVRYLERTIQKIQDMKEIDEIVVVSSTVPDVSFVNHDSTLQDTPLINLMGNSYLMSAVKADVNKKISTWCFGSYSSCTDEIRNGIRFVSNPRGLTHDLGSWPTYHPKRISL
jgi:hypothetical protein